jgi:tRNA threonylcarbamoyladenosine biosynthesis protein TsaE
METVSVTTLEELSSVTKQIFDSYKGEDGAFVIALTGELGAGKTAFVKELAKHLGVTHEVTSPTFVIMKTYPVIHTSFDTLVHIDAYRIESDDEMRVLGFDDILKRKENVVCIEWPEKISNCIPTNAYRVSLMIEEGDTRTITYGA